MTCQSSRWRMRSGADAYVCLLPQGHDWYGGLLDDSLQDGVTGHVVRERLERQQEAVTHDAQRDVEDFLRQCVIPASDKGEGARREHQVDRRSWARAVGDVTRDLLEPVFGRRPGCRDQSDGVLEQRGVDVDAVGLRLETEQVV